MYSIPKYLYTIPHYNEAYVEYANSCGSWRAHFMFGIILLLGVVSTSSRSGPGFDWFIIDKKFSSVSHHHETYTNMEVVYK